MSATVSQYNTYPSIPEGHGQVESPPAANMQQLNLPPIRSGEGVQGRPSPQPPSQSQQQQQPGQMPHAMQYYLAPGQSFSMPGADPNQPVRYPIPPADSRIMSGGRHKKEIKRRTKTGCLTCRKRRIKCDEQHPACRNCQKSKRDCLGYDPIFKPQPGPAAIQPAIGSSPGPHSSTAPPPYPPVYAPGYPGYPAIPHNSEHSSSEPPDYSAAIDPALGGTMATGGEGGAGGGEGGASAHASRVAELLALNGIPPPALPPPAPIPSKMQTEMMHIWNTIYAPGIDKFLETKWFANRGHMYLAANPSIYQQFAMLYQRYTIDPRDPNYQHSFSVTLSLEAATIWSMMNMCRNPPPAAPHDPKPDATKDTNESSVPSGDTQTNTAVANGDSTPRFSDDDVREGVRKAAKRLDMIEALLLGTALDESTLPRSLSTASSSGGPPTIIEDEDGPQPTTTTLNDQLRSREVSFWHHIHLYLTLAPPIADNATKNTSSSSPKRKTSSSPSPPSQQPASASADPPPEPDATTLQKIDDAIGTCRNLLDSRENRDVMYSILIARHLGGKFVNSGGENGEPVLAGSTKAENNEESDVNTRVIVAKKFIEDEAGGKGTSQIVQRLCGMAVRSWALRAR